MKFEDRLTTLMNSENATVKDAMDLLMYANARMISQYNRIERVEEELKSMTDENNTLYYWLDCANKELDLMTEVNDELDTNNSNLLDQIEKLHKKLMDEHIIDLTNEEEIIDLTGE